MDQSRHPADNASGLSDLNLEGANFEERQRMPNTAHAASGISSNDDLALTDYPFQRTLKSSVSCAGIGLHLGHTVTMTLHPAAADTGIIFRRLDAAGNGAEIKAHWDAVVDTRLCTTIGNKQGLTVSTTEHLVAAFAGLGVDNAIVDIDAAELPVMDGSSAPFVSLIEQAGIVDLAQPRRVIEILRTVQVGDETRSATLSPATIPSLSFEIDFANPVIGRQKFAVDMMEGTFQSCLSEARTFGFEKEVAMLRQMGLAKGGSLENAVVLSDDAVLNEDGLRFDDEFVRHKLLDSVGDLFLAGGYIRGHFHGFKAGHELNNQLLHAVFADKANWRWASGPATMTAGAAKPPVAQAAREAANPAGPAGDLRAVAAAV